jgi:hypothetical protein
MATSMSGDTRMGAADGCGRKLIFFLSNQEICTMIYFV